jgi:hypothetical protein
VIPFKMVAVCACLLLVACPRTARRDPIAERAEAIVHMPSEERRQAVSGLRPDEQLDVYMYAYTKMEPPKVLASEVASSWKTVLPILESRTTSETSSRKLAGLIMIFAAISYNECSLAGQQDVLATTSEAVTKISPPFRKVAEEQLREIAHPTKQLPPCR